MSSGLDVFKIESSGAAVWLFATTTAHEAHQRINELASKHPAHYLILNLVTGHRIDVPRTTVKLATSTASGIQPQL